MIEAARRERRRTVSVVLLFVGLTVLMTYPLSVHPTSRVFSDVPDTWLTIWSLVWDTHAFTHRPWAIFDANIYYPLDHTLAFSENFIGSALFAAPIIWLTGNPVFALNVAALLTVVLCGVGAYRLARTLGISAAGAIVCGIVFAFSPPRFLRTSQLHLGAVQWLPFGLASLHAYFERGRRQDLRWAAACLAAQALTSGYGTAYLTITAALLIVYRIIRGAPVRVMSWPRDLGVPGVLALGVVVLVFMPYLSLQREYGFRRTLAGWTGTRWWTFLASPSHVQAWFVSWFPAARVNEAAEAYLFPGFLPLAIGFYALLRRPRPNVVLRIVAAALTVAAASALICGAAYLIRGPYRIHVGDIILLSVKSGWRPWLLLLLTAGLRLVLARRVPVIGLAALHLREGDAHGARLFYALLFVISIWLMLAPPYGLWPHVFTLPGFSLMRSPTRFMIVGILALGVLAGFGVDRLTAGAPRPTAIVAVALLAEFACFPVWTDPMRVAIPAADRWLASRPMPFVVAEVPDPPTAYLGASERRQTQFMIHSTAHWQRTVHGYSGFRLDLHTELYNKLVQFPDPASLDALEQLGVTYVVVHTDLYSDEERAATVARLPIYANRLREVYADADARVYALTNASARRAEH